MFYYKYFDEEQNLVGVEQRSTMAVGERQDIVEISEDEYRSILESIVPEDVDPDPAEEISDSEALAIIVGGAGVC